MNDTTVWCQNASVTEPQRDRGTTIVVDEAFEKINFAQCSVIVGATAKNLFFNPRWHHAAIAPKLATAAAKGESRHVLRARLRKKSPRERQPKQDVRRSEGKREKLSTHCILLGNALYCFPVEGH